jgi:hypothetical protein
MTSDRLEVVEELARRLRPVIGERADEYARLWLLEDRKGRDEIERLMQVEYREHFPDPDAVVLPPPAEVSGGDGVRVGSIMQGDAPAGTFVVPPRELLRHCLITGATGTGKTTLVYQFVREFLRLGIPFFLFDFKLDYRPLARLDERVRVYTVGQDIAPLAFNPLVELARPIIVGKRLADLSPLFLLSDALCRVFYAGHGVRSLLNKAFTHVVQQWAEHDGHPDFTPTFQAALQWIREYEGKGDGKGMRLREWKLSTVRILEQLSMGEYGRQANVAADRHVPLAEMRGHPTVFELNLSEDLKNAFVELLLLCGRQLSVAELKERQRGELRHVMIVDESHNLLREYPGLGESQLQLALREHRGLGTAYILTDQTPGQLDKTALANTRYKFFFALLERGDIQVAARSLLLERDQVGFLSRLPIGRCVARYGTGRPFVLQVPPADDVMLGVVPDVEVRERMGRLSGFSGPETGKNWENGPVSGSDEDRGMSEAEKRLLVDILKEPFAGVQKHYDRIGVSSRNGNRVKERLEELWLVRSHEISPGASGGRMLILELTEKGVAFLQRLGYDCRYPYYAGGAEHEYGKDIVAKYLQGRGYRTVKEYQVPDDGRVDVLGERDGERVAVEVETGKSDIQANLKKTIAGGFDRVAVYATNPDARRAVERAAGEHPGVEILTAADLDGAAASAALPDLFFGLSGPEKLLLLAVADHPKDYLAHLPPLPGLAVPRDVWGEAQEGLLQKGLVEPQDGQVGLTARGRDLLKSICFTN